MRGYTLVMPQILRLQTRYDEYSIPVSAKCSICGEQMPQGKPRIVQPADNVAWFAVQFDLHVTQRHRQCDFRDAAAQIVNREASDEQGNQ